MADDNHPFMNALLDGMTNGVEQSAGTLLAQLKSKRLRVRMCAKLSKKEHHKSLNLKP